VFLLVTQELRVLRVYRSQYPIQYVNRYRKPLWQSFSLNVIGVAFDREDERVLPRLPPSPCGPLSTYSLSQLLPPSLKTHYIYCLSLLSELGLDKASASIA